MKRILFFLLLLVNLQLTTDKGSLSIGFGEVSAQRMVEYSITKKSTNDMIDGYLYCPYGCGAKYFYDTDLQEHIENNCPYHQKTHCYLCDTDYYPDEGEHWCPICCICNQPLKYCRCKGAVIIGKDGNKYTLGSSGWVPVEDDIADDNSGGGIGGGPFTYDMSGFSISIRDLKRKQGVKLVSQTKLPDQLHPQTLVAECVIRAYAFMAQLKGYDYETAYATLSNIAFNAGYDLERLDGGIDCDQLQKLFKSYAIIAAGPNTPENVAQFIDRGIPVALVTEEIINGKKYKHMVTVIGYDGKYYYTAAGYPNGMATIYDKKECEKISQLFIVDNIKTPFKSPKK